ncbi:uncharacterized protein LOC144585137 [Pogona vitticeps]
MAPSGGGSGGGGEGAREGSRARVAGLVTAAAAEEEEEKGKAQAGWVSEEACSHGVWGRLLSSSRSGTGSLWQPQASAQEAGVQIAEPSLGAPRPMSCSEETALGMTYVTAG